MSYSNEIKRVLLKHDNGEITDEELNRELQEIEAAITQQINCTVDLLSDPKCDNART